MDLLPLLNMNKAAQRVPKPTQMDKSYELLASQMADQKRALPTQVLQSELEQAKSKRAQLKALESKTAKGAEDSSDEDAM